MVLKSNEGLKDALVETLEMSPIDGAKGVSKPIWSWDVSAVTDMSKLFVDDFGQAVEGATKFNGDLSKWDVSRVVNMASMFFPMKSFNGDLSKWDVSKVTDMVSMFRSASSFNSDISNWNVSSVVRMNVMFSGASSFAQKLCGDAWVSSTAAQFGMFTGSLGQICTNFPPSKATSIKTPSPHSD